MARFLDMDPAWETPWLLMILVVVPCGILRNLIIYRVNKHLPPEERVPWFFNWGHGRFLKREYRRLYPGSCLYTLWEVLGSVLAVFYIAFVMWHTWHVGNGLYVAFWAVLTALWVWFWDRIQR